MGIIISNYKKQFLRRYDSNGYVKYLTPADFPGLEAAPFSFTSFGNTIRGYFYSYPNADKGPLVIFCHGIGGGHRAYMAEIATLCAHGYTVLSYDNAGCFESEGKDIGCIASSVGHLNAAITALDGRYDRIFVVGHSWGGYAAANIANLRNDVEKSVVISGPLSVEESAKGLLRKEKLPFKGTILRTICNFERNAAPDLFPLNALDAVKSGRTKYLFAHSTDDSMVPYDISLAVLEREVPGLRTIIYHDRKHNPNYTPDALAYMRSVFGEFAKAKKSLKTLEMKQRFFADVDWHRMTAQDNDFWQKVTEFLDEE